MQGNLVLSVMKLVYAFYLLIRTMQTHGTLELNCTKNNLLRSQSSKVNFNFTISCWPTYVTMLFGDDPNIVFFDFQRNKSTKHEIWNVGIRKEPNNTCTQTNITLYIDIEKKISKFTNKTLLKVYYLTKDGLNISCYKLVVLPRLTDEKDLSRQTDETKQTRTILISVIVVLIVIIICCSKKDSLKSFFKRKINDHQNNSDETATINLEENESNPISNEILVSTQKEKKQTFMLKKKVTDDDISIQPQVPAKMKLDPPSSTNRGENADNQNDHLQKKKKNKKNFLFKKKETTENRNLISTKECNVPSGRYIPPRPKDDQLPLTPIGVCPDKSAIDPVLERQRSNSDVMKTPGAVNFPPQNIPPSLILTEEEEEEGEEEYQPMEAGVISNPFSPPISQTTIMEEEEGWYDDCIDSNQTNLPGINLQRRMPEQNEKYNGCGHDPLQFHPEDQQCDYEVLPSVPERCPVKR